MVTMFFFSSTTLESCKLARTIKLSEFKSQEYPHLSDENILAI